jgi:hypothetical protein
LPSPAADLIVLDTLGKLADRGYRIGGYCLDGRRLVAVSLTLTMLMLERGRAVPRYAWRPCGALAAARRRRTALPDRRKTKGPNPARFGPKSLGDALHLG